MVSVLKLVVLCVFAKLKLYIKTFINTLTLFSSLSHPQPATTKSTRQKFTTGLEFGTLIQVSDFCPCIICTGDNCPASRHTLYFCSYVMILVLKVYPLHECI